MREREFAMNTRFEKDMFTWDGMYLMYKGDFAGSVKMETVHPDCHPSWIGKNKPQFVARFKYRKPWKTWVNFLVKNEIFIEDWMGLAYKTSPLQAMQHYGYKGN